MRTLIISDVHANFTALTAVLEAAAPFDQVWSLGDIVGYGPDPNECIEMIQTLPATRCVKGNHDAAILDEIDIQSFNYEARASLDWQRSNLGEDNRGWLETLKARMIFDDFTIVHGSPRNPIWEYVMDVRAARENITAFETKFCLVGHTHIPCVYEMQSDKEKSTGLSQMPIGDPIVLENKCIINPGSVGQPRDHDSRASFIIYDDDEQSWVNHRVEYDVEQVQKRILAAGLPERHAERLSQGW